MSDEFDSDPYRTTKIPTLHGAQTEPYESSPKTGPSNKKLLNKIQTSV